ncbi:DUF4190 domain-containing protein [Streptomyces sp. NBC_00094]|uniref:DUF4190 domain-containing protein n=1 Tax=Streptomyces sp. NBC_00094 TaxID=2903620 RepID=UPI0022595C47|nr:DUF4190 domain-containing protein [Streptomyces sp. NBC_00094]MCX5392956.1 DUF4190 domain-containing protein [Streptomyces sp. NBC_00094]
MEPTQPPQPPPTPQGAPQQQGWPAPGPYTSPGMPYAAGPYGPPGAPGVGPYGQPIRSTNGLAIGSLVSGIVCCLPPLGLVLGLIALPQIRKKDQAGKGLAIAGIILSVTSCLLVLIGFVTGGFGSVVNGFKEGMDEAARTKSPFSLRTGQCFLDDGKLEEYATDVEIVDCAKPHDGEVTGSFELTGIAKWPGESAIDELAEKRCDAINSAYALDTWAVPVDVWVFYYMPSSQSWRGDDRTVTCAFASEDRTFSGSVRSDAPMLTADQERFLEAVNPIETVSYREPDEDPDEDFAANQAWAVEMLAAVDEARAELGRDPWTGVTKAPVAALVKQLDAASKQWRKLAGAADAEAYWEAYDVAWEALPEDLGADARTALDLTDTPPVGEDASGSV